jgi:uncharacterized membrane protein
LSTDTSTERRDVKVLLRLGLGVGAALMAAGLVAALLAGPLPSQPLRVSALWHGELAPSIRLCGLGILVLSATPAFRVITLIILWIRERDWKYALVAVAVAAVLVLAIALGGG